jgi:dTDP-4-dehydrorhamnose reductase
MKTILVTGASGFLGWNVCKLHQTKWHVVGSYLENKEGIYPKMPALPIDLTDKDQTWKALKEVKPTAVFHLAAHSSTNFCEKNPAKSRALNVEGTATLAEMCLDRGIRLVFTSSEQVFDGLRETYSESDEPDPRNEYGKQKLEAEQLVQEIFPEAAIARVSVMYGETGSSASCFLSEWLDAWQRFMPVTAFYDEIRTFLSGASAAQGLFILLEKDASGIFHLGGGMPLSRHEFAVKAKEIFKIPAAVVISRSQSEVESTAYRPPNLSLDCAKISELGFSPTTVEYELKQLAGKTVIQPPPTAN